MFWATGRWATSGSSIFCGCGHLSTLLSWPSKPLLWLWEGQGFLLHLQCHFCEKNFLYSCWSSLSTLPPQRHSSFPISVHSHTIHPTVQAKYLESSWILPSLTFHMQTHQQVPSTLFPDFLDSVPLTSTLLRSTLVQAPRLSPYQLQ